MKFLGPGWSRRMWVAGLVAGLWACDGSDGAPGAGGPSGGGGAGGAGGAAGPPRAAALGTGDGSAGSVSFTRIYTSPRTRQSTDLAFNPVRPNELWILHREPKSEAPCTEASATRSGCESLEGSVTILTDPGTTEMGGVWKKDDNAWHFMRRPPALAFGPGDTFATCGEERTGNFLDGEVDFIGPTLWSSDPAVFAVTPSGGNGSHLDMLHESPFCMGIAHEQGNVYWVHNGQRGSLDRYDFAQDHGPGNEDHSDGVLHRYAEGEVARVPDVPSHMVYWPPDRHLYVADTGNRRVIKLDTSSGQRGGPVTPVYEPLADHAVFMGSTVVEVVPARVLMAPSGLEIHAGILYVADHATSRIHAFDLGGEPIRSLATDLPAGSLAGLTFGPDDKIYFVDVREGHVTRIDP